MEKSVWEGGEKTLEPVARNIRCTSRNGGVTILLGL
jgi:hypothetical protein